MLPATMRDQFIGLLMETGNVSKVARTLGINRMTAYQWRDDPEFLRRWDVALDMARQGLQERVVETACAMGVGEWVPALDPLTDEPELDDDFEPVLRFETRHVDARILMKLMDKTMRDEVRRVDQRTAIAGRVEHEHYPGLVLVDADGGETPLLHTDKEDEDADLRADFPRYQHPGWRTRAPGRFPSLSAPGLADPPPRSGPTP